jgi:hypothetical protein
MFRFQRSLLGLGCPADDRDSARHAGTSRQRYMLEAFNEFPELAVLVPSMAGQVSTCSGARLTLRVDKRTWAAPLSLLSPVARAMSVFV